MSEDISALIDQLSPDNDPGARQAAAQELERLVEEGKLAPDVQKQALAQLYKSVLRQAEDEALRISALNAIVTIEDDKQGVVSYLSGLLRRQDDPKVRNAALEKLRDLVKTSEDDDVPAKAWVAILRFGTADEVKQLVTDPDIERDDLENFFLSTPRDVLDKMWNGKTTKRPLCDLSWPGWRTTIGRRGREQSRGWEKRRRPRPFRRPRWEKSSVNCSCCEPKILTPTCSAERAKPWGRSILSLLRRCWK